MAAVMSAVQGQRSARRSRSRRPLRAMRPATAKSRRLGQLSGQGPKRRATPTMHLSLLLDQEIAPGP